MQNWSETTLQKLCRAQLAGKRVIAVSNCEPYVHQFKGEGIECTQPASGLATALGPILRATGGTWVAHGRGDADRHMVDGHDHLPVPPGSPQYTLRRVWLDERTEREYYYGLANEGLWPLCHVAFHRPTFRTQDWESYRRANRIFANAVLEEAAGEPAFVLIQDYHFALLPRMLKERNPKLVIGHFWHIPWPNQESFRVFPWGEELLDGLLGNDLLGFHLRDHCSNFLDSVELGIEARVDTEHSRIRRRGAETAVGSFPISIDYDRHAAEAAGGEVEREMQEWVSRLGGRPEFLAIGIDRADYTKGITERLQSVDRFLELHPEYRGRFMFVQIAVPTRTMIDGYRGLNTEIQDTVNRVNARWAAGNWRPIVYCNRHFSQRPLMALHRLAQVCIVSSLHDGMNLVAKEYVASRVDGDGSLILSKFTGAARELTTALLVNPFSPDEMARTLHRAMQMSLAERRARMSRMNAVVREHNIYEWAGNILTAMGALHAQRTLLHAVPPRLHVAGAPVSRFGTVN